jgi:hypothetical protein
MRERLAQQLEALADSIRMATRERLAAEESIRGLSPAAKVVGVGIGDVTYGIDLESEIVVSRWFEDLAREEPISLLTEDTGWRHAGPASGGGWRELNDFDHGGPRIAIDPIDGTRPLLGDLRSAWTSIAACPAGPEQPLSSDVSYALLGELPTSTTETWRLIRAESGRGATIERCTFAATSEASRLPLIADTDDRADHGVFSFFRYSVQQRPLLARIEVDFFERIAAKEGADLMHCYDDQYTCNVGQIVHLCLGSYRMIADLRAHLSGGFSAPITTSKPYDLAAALLVGREAGCAMRAADGAELSFPLDATTPVSFIGWANQATEERLSGHLNAALSAVLN